MRPDLEGAHDLLATFARRRQQLLKHAADLLCSDPAVSQEPSDRESKLSALLVSTLEELKVVQEELVERTEALADLRAEIEETARLEHQLFELAPACLLVTDILGNILEVNRACQQLWRSDMAALARQPFARFLPVHDRRAFRDGLARILETDGVSDWRLTLVRQTDAPLRVRAAVRVVRPVLAGGKVRLSWALSPLDLGEAMAIA